MVKKFNPKKLLRLVVSTVVTVFFLIYLYFNHHQLVDSLKNIEPQYLLLVLLGQVLGQLANSGVLRSTLRPLDVHLGFLESFKVTIVSSFVNFFAPLLGGASTRAVYMKRRHGLPYTSLISTLYANYGIMFSVSFIFGLIGVFIVPGAMSDVGLALALFFAAGLAGSLLFLLTSHHVVKLIRRLPINHKSFKGIVDKLVMIDEGWSRIRKDRQAIMGMSFWSTMANLSLLLVYWSATASLGIKTSFGAFMIFAAFASVSLLLNLTPGNVGIRESLYASIYKITGVGLQRVIAFSLIDRAGQIVVIGLGWLLFGQSVIKATEHKAPPLGAEKAPSN